MMNNMMSVEMEKMGGKLFMVILQSYDFEISKVVKAMEDISKIVESQPKGLNSTPNEEDMHKIMAIIYNRREFSEDLIGKSLYDLFGITTTGSTGLSTLTGRLFDGAIPEQSSSKPVESDDDYEFPEHI